MSEPVLEFLAWNLRLLGATVIVDAHHVTAVAPQAGGDVQPHPTLVVEARSDGAWWFDAGSQGELALVGATPPNVVAAVAGELLLAQAVPRGVAPPHRIPPPAVRALRKEGLAERLVVVALGGKPASAGKAGFDLESPQHGRVQVKSSVRNPRSGLLSSLRFATLKGWTDHDWLVYVELTPHNWPLGAWMINSDVLRLQMSAGTGVPNTKSHHVAEFIQASGTDLTAEVQQAMDILFPPPG